MFNRKIEITRENESILFINSVIENLRYGIISLDIMLSCGEEDIYQKYYDEHTFYFFHMQSVLTAQGNIHNVLYNDFYDKKTGIYGDPCFDLLATRGGTLCRGRCV